MNANTQTQEEYVASLKVEKRMSNIKMRREKLIELLKKREEWVKDIENDSYYKKIMGEINNLDEEEFHLILSS